MIATAVRAAILALSLAAILPAAAATSIEVSPVSHDLVPGQTMLSMTLSNRADATATLQVRAFVWTQPDGQDRLTPAAEVLVAPAIVSVAPGRSQVVRVRAPAAPAGREVSYRLLIDELPEASADTQVRMVLRLSIPVFVHGSTPAAPRLTAQLDAARGTVTLANGGGSRARVQQLALLAPDGERLAVAPAANPYLLSGAQRPWAFAPAARPLPARPDLRVLALTDAGPVEVPLVASP